MQEAKVATKLVEFQIEDDNRLCRILQRKTFNKRELLGRHHQYDVHVRRLNRHHLEGYSHRIRRVKNRLSKTESYMDKEA